MSPACDSDPGRDPKPPSKFMHEITNSTAFSTSIASSFPCTNLNTYFSFLSKPAISVSFESQNAISGWKFILSMTMFPSSV
jgi:hypothetical protein